MKKFSGIDFVNLEDLLSDQEKQIRDMVRKFVTQDFLPVVVQHFREGSFPDDLVPKMGEMGLLGCNLEGYGCAGLTATEYGLIMQELERGDSGLRSFASVQSSLCMFPVHQFGSDEQKEAWLPLMARGEKIGCFGLTEPDFGSNPGGMLTTAKATDSGYVLNGTKRWITNGTLADMAIIWAKLEGEVQGFLVPADSPGFIAKDIPGKLSLRASVTSELVLDECEIPKNAILPKAKGLKAALECLSAARFGIVWGALGAAMACFEEVLHFVKERESFGTPLAQKQLVQSKLVQMVTEITKAQLLAWRLAQLKNESKLKHYQISMGKMNNVQMALDISRICRDLLGASGISDEYQCMRHMVNLESVHTYEGTYDIHQLIIGQKLTGLSAL